MKWENIILHKKSSLAIVCLLGILLLQSSIMSVHAPARKDWIVKLRQTAGTTATIYNCNFTKDGANVGGHIDKLTCTGNQTIVTIKKESLTADPNDFHYNINITWPGPTFEQHRRENISAPGSKKYTHSPAEVVLEIPAPVGGVWVPVDKIALLAPYIGLVSTILVATAATAIYVKRRSKRQ